RRRPVGAVAYGPAVRRHLAGGRLPDAHLVAGRPGRGRGRPALRPGPGGAGPDPVADRVHGGADLHPPPRQHLAPGARDRTAHRRREGVTAGPPDEQERRARLRLARTDRVGPVTFRELLRRCGSAEAALDALPALARRAGGAASPPPEDAIDAELAAGEALGARLTVWGDPAYPPALAACDPPPPVLWTLGDVGLLARPSAAVVGARIASAAGQRFARGLAAGLGEAGLMVVSGLARGIDAAAHEGALDTGTIAV